LTKPSILKLVTRLAGVAPIVDARRHAVVFTHIGKTGGTTLDHIFRAAALARGERACRPRAPRPRLPPSQQIQELFDLDLIDPDSLAGCDYLSGHFPFGIHTRMPRPCLYVTLLREPVARLLSNIRFGLERGKWPRDTSITALIEEGRLIDNMQTRQIAGVADRSARCTAQTSDAAIENLRLHYAIVGLTERFDDTLKALITLLGWPDVAYSDRQVSRAPVDPDLESRVREAAQRYFALDSELYAYAAARPTLWNSGVLQGSATGNAPQDSVLVTSPLVSFNERPYGLVPRAFFESRVCAAVRQRGVEVVVV
jgi:hypothetical protein